MGNRKVGIIGISVIVNVIAIVLGVLAILLEGTVVGGIFLVLQISIAGTYILAISILGWKRRRKDFIA